MSTPEERINAAIVQLEGDAEKIQTFRSGSETETVDTNSGPVPTVAGLVKEIRETTAETVTEAVQAASEARVSAQSANARAASAEQASAQAVTTANSAKDLALSAQQSASGSAQSASENAAAALSSAGASSSAAVAATQAKDLALSAQQSASGSAQSASENAAAALSSAGASSSAAVAATQAKDLALSAQQSASGSAQSASENAAAALSSAGASSSAAASATSASATAEAARDATVVGAAPTIYADTTAGLAATTNGTYFSVPSADAAEYLTLYLNNAGAAVEKKRYPSTAALDAVRATLREDAPSEVVFTVADEAGFAHFLVQEDGSFGGLSARVSPDKVETEAFALSAAPDGARFAVGDDSGYFAVYVQDNQTLRDTDALSAAVAALQAEAVAPVVSAAIPTSGRRVIAHRGSTVGGIAPENSLDAYKLAARAGYRLVETDVLKTSDGQFVLMHDGSINRTCRNAGDYSTITGTVNVLDTPLATLRANYVLAASHPRYRRKIPTLAEFLATCRDFNLYPVIELKNQNFSNADVAAIADQAVAVLGTRGFGLCSFNLSQLDYVRTLYADIELYYIYGTVGSTAIDHMVAQAPAALYANYSAYNPANIAEARQKGVKLAAWTIPNAQFDPMLKLGLDEFATDTIAPELTAQSVIFRDYSAGAFSVYTTTGTLSADGLLTLAQGQNMSFAARTELHVDFGAYYLSLDYLGDAALSANRLNINISNSADDYATHCAQCLLANESFAVTITAGVGGCIIKDINLAIAKF